LGWTKVDQSGGIFSMSDGHDESLLSKSYCRINENPVFHFITVILVLRIPGFCCKTWRWNILILVIALHF
jgi:hypothetical protein